MSSSEELSRALTTSAMLSSMVSEPASNRKSLVTWVKKMPKVYMRTPMSSMAHTSDLRVQTIE
eukprot:CAMPEP_0171117270 /NCGR_PEP_ID=MMETSP0766_2-20121228/92103_1 /TAXON_ID=439317 /ORGANISM="Gambierdiscus australes, Strain CAWD 149" /LENGTH=62 /DNA_ID=CAMNT_0011579769 /DNA_START=49 /DNA_END=237 /DNA_ORIENTATION=+